MTIRPLAAGVALRARSTTVLMTAWREGDSVVRARFDHIESGLTSYVQGNDSLIALGEKLGLMATREPSLGQ
ncbi:MAG: hypothetical protein WB609_06750 [Candidatus Cybelea sp.]